MYKCMEQVRWHIQSRLSETETEMSVIYIYLYFVQMKVSSLRLTKLFKTWEQFQVHLLTVELYLQDETMSAAVLGTYSSM